jgi:hypothetical protein
MPRTYEKRIEILSYSWGVASGEAESFDFTAAEDGDSAMIIKRSDVFVTSYQTGALGNDVATGLPTGKREVAEGGLLDPEPGSEPSAYELSDVLISSYQTGGSSGDDASVDDVSTSLNFDYGFF